MSRFSLPVLFRMFIVVAINIMPMVVLDFPIWLVVLISLLLATFTLASIPYLGIWIWAAVVIVGRPFTWFTIVFFVCMLLCVSSAIVVLKMTFGKNKSYWN